MKGHRERWDEVCPVVSMASVVPAEADDSLICSVCHELFTDPKLLPCGHLTCKNCLISWLNSKKDASCPLCRSGIVEAMDGGSGSLEDVVDGLPTDLSMCKLVEAERLLNRQHQCCACESVLATCLCFDCADLICKSCAKVHVKFSATKNHVVKDLSGLTAEKLAADDHRPSPCAHHPGEVCNLYCPSHQEFMCHVCSVTRHRSCQEVKDLEEKLKEAGALLTELVDRLKEGQRAVSHSLQQLDQHLQDSQKKTQALIEEIDALCHRLQRAVEQCGRRLKDLVRKASSEVQEATTEGKTHLLQRKGKLTCHQNVAHRIQGMKATDQAANMATLMKTRLDDMDLSGTLPQGFKVISNLTLVISTEAVSTVEKMMTQLGEVRVTPAELSAQPQAPTWSFHDNHGTSITLSNNGQTADRVDGATSAGDGIVMARDSMEINTLYQVEMNEVLSKWSYQYNMLGVTVQTPDSISLPLHVYSGSPFAILIDHYRVLKQGSESKSTPGARLRDVRAGSRVGLLLDGKRDIHLYVDDTDLGVFASAVPHPCFVIIDLHASWKKVSTLPLRRVK